MTTLTCLHRGPKHSHEAVGVVCLHGIGGAADNFEAVLAGLSACHPVLSLNLPGYQGSDLVSPMTFETLSEAVIDALDQHAFKTAHFVGHSIGGMIALECAARSPRRVQSLALVATTSAFGGRDGRFQDAFLKARLAPLDAGQTLADLAPGFVAEIVGPNTSEAARATAIRSMAAVPEATYRAILACLVTFNRRALLPDINIPCLLVAGDQDQNAPARTMEKMHQTIPDSDFHCLPDTGHLIPLERPEILSGLLKQFYLTQPHARP